MTPAQQSAAFRTSQGQLHRKARAHQTHAQPHRGRCDTLNRPPRPREHDRAPIPGEGEQPEGADGNLKRKANINIATLIYEWRHVTRGVTTKQMG